MGAKSDEIHYSAKKGKVLDSVNVPLEEGEKIATLRRDTSRLSKNSKVAEANPELKDIADFANSGIQEQIKQLKEARKEARSQVRLQDSQTKYAKGGVTRADGCISKGHTRGKMV
jgi:hypothetical protein